MEPTTTLNIERSRNAILNDGFFTSDDEVIGAKVHRMDEDAIPLASAAGLRFCRDNIFENPRIRQVLESFFESSSLGLYRSIGANNGDYTFASSVVPDPETEVLLVQLWDKESEVIYWKRSYKNWLDPVRAENSLLRVPRARLVQLGLQPQTIRFKNGGFAILDGRTAFEIRKGTAITFAFATQAKLEAWRPMKLPRLKEIERVVADMKSKSLGLNVEYIGED